ncbi:helix-turn-helix domain-containing protein [Psychroserpens luteolus]|uniref:helix-turn-helix domain-containing protein n=1 Tax=Psychroserpens luteolus TaxID=2855840 RepID=UPI001E5921CF|nr:helix-turn-helix transcriptional regulator [Psychroserpens luteolus]MCD2259909.1 helix-turn-helix transcriptional regulator [Psychroserpens luteolus]
MLKTSLLKHTSLIFIICSCLLCSSQSEQEHYTIKGSIQLDSTWSKKVYLSLIPSFNKMFTMSNSMIVSVADIDTNGNFKFDTSFLPEKEHLYRVHIAKKNAPPASLIIGGKDENHMFLITKKSSNIYVSKNKSQTPFYLAEIEGDLPNFALSEINKIARFVDSTSVEETYLKREFITKGINEKLRFVADTSSNALVSLYALYKSKYETNYDINKQFYTDYLIKWEGNSSTYFKEFRNSLPLPKEEKSYMNISIGLVCFLGGIVLSYYLFVVRKSNKLRSLSVQERKIFSLIKDGKSNKEISDELNIGLSTVKSHASNIYAKLGIKSRKEILDINV